MAESDLSEFLAGNDQPQKDALRDPSGAQDPPPSGGAGNAAHDRNAVPLGNRFLIFPDRPAPNLNGPTSMAFDARDNRDPNASVFALVCHRELPPRVDITQSLRGVDQAWLTAPLDHGFVLWGDPPAHRHAFVFDKPGGKVINRPGRPDRAAFGRAVHADLPAAGPQRLEGAQGTPRLSRQHQCSEPLSRTWTGEPVACRRMRQRPSRI